jgi:hypothetical protein
MSAAEKEAVTGVNPVTSIDTLRGRRPLSRALFDISARLLTQTRAYARALSVPLLSVPRTVKPERWMPRVDSNHD